MRIRDGALRQLLRRQASRTQNLTARIIARLWVGFAVPRAGPPTTEVVVALTTYPARAGQVHRTVKSILLQNACPIVVLYLAREEFPDEERSLSRRLSALVRRYPDRLSVRFLQGNALSYKKLIPALNDFPGRTIVTVDDDVIYTSEWMALLLRTAAEHPDTIVGTRGSWVSRRADGTLAPYRDWPTAPADEASHSVFLTGRGGILYPPHSLSLDVFDLQRAMKLAPRGDDIWFKACALKAGTRAVRTSTHRELPDSGADQKSALYRHNLYGDANDRAMELVFESLGVLHQV